MRFFVNQFFCVCHGNGKAQFRETMCNQVLCQLGETGIETFNKLKQAYREHALSRSQVFKWHKAVSEGRESIKDEP